MSTDRLQQVISIVLLAFLFVSCNIAPITKGYVTFKEDIPAYQGSTCHYVLQGTFPVCRTRIPIQVPETWLVSISSCTPKDAGQWYCDANALYVSKTTYDKAQLDQYIDLERTK